MLEYPTSAKNMIPCFQTFMLKPISSTATEYYKNCVIIKKNVPIQRIKRKSSKGTNQKIDRIESFTVNNKRTILEFQYKQQTTQNSLIYLKFEENLEYAINKYRIHGIFQTRSMIAIKRSKNLQEVTEGPQLIKETFFRKVYIEKTKN